MSEPRWIPLIVLGVGNVGRTFLSQLTRTHLSLAHRYGIDLQPVALGEIHGAILDAKGLPSTTIEAVLTAKASQQSFAEQPGALMGITSLDLIDHIAGQGVENAIVIDTTAADGMEAVLRRALDLGYGVVLSNKRPLTVPWSSARGFFEHPRMRFEATVGAGLPAIYTLRYLVDAGDVVMRIEGALSGTLGYLCSCLENGEAFSEAVRTAKAKGYTEPDPRDDLGGMDVARKALILGRLAGWPLEPAHVQVEPLFPAEMAALSLDEFMTQLPRLDADFVTRLDGVRGAPRYMAEITPDKGAVGLRTVDEHLAAQLRGTLNLVSFTTQRYAEYPLALLGPGAGREVTAAAVLQDCVQLAQIMAR